MKPCANNQKRLAMLALDDVARPEADLRAHLESCAECRGYLDEISSVTKKLRRAQPASDIRPSDSFHRNLLTTLAGTKRMSFADVLSARMQTFRSWRIALPIATTAVFVFAAWSWIGPRAAIPTQPPSKVALVAVAPARANLEPTFSNYEMAVHQSLDKLDELLDAQNKKNIQRPPSYTAARFPQSFMAD